MLIENYVKKVETLKMELLGTAPTLSTKTKKQSPANEGAYSKIKNVLGNIKDAEKSKEKQTIKTPETKQEAKDFGNT